MSNISESDNFLNVGSINKSDIDSAFGKIFKAFRLENGLTQDELAEKLGISLKYISRIENGYSGVKTQTLIKYMNLLGISPNLIYKDFITNEYVKKQISLSEKIASLNEEELIFAENIVDMIKKLRGSSK